LKTLYLIRHAKSDWGNESLTDIDRPLNARGYNDAHKMSLLLKATGDPSAGSGQFPDVIFTSNAIRALSTAVIFARNLEVNAKNIRIKERIYESTPAQLFRILHKINDRCNIVFLVCHNPGITAAVNLLCLSTIENIPTTGIACIDLSIDKWEDLAAGTGKLRSLMLPRSLV
jgi:phosphohistidine phosphatase